MPWNVWRRGGVLEPEGIGRATSHSTSAERFVRNEEAIAEIRGRWSRDEPVRPARGGRP